MKRLVVLIWALLLAAPILAAELPPGWRRAESGALVHTETSFTFLPKWKGMTRTEPVAWDHEGRNTAIGYNSSAPRLALTLYIYPAGTDPEEDFKGAVQAALQLNDKVRVERAKRMDLPLGDATVSGYNAFIHWPEASGEVGSFLALIPQERSYLKLRVTFEMGGDAGPMEHAWTTAQGFLRSLRASDESVETPAN